MTIPLKSIVVLWNGCMFPIHTFELNILRLYAKEIGGAARMNNHTLRLDSSFKRFIVMVSALIQTLLLSLLYVLYFLLFQTIFCSILLYINTMLLK